MPTTTLERGYMDIDKKRINVSQKRQITIPQKYFEKLSIGTEVECILREDGIVIKPIYTETSGYFAEEILKELIAKGLSGERLLEEFRKLSLKVRPAVQAMIAEADKVAGESKGSGDDEMNEIFGD